MTLDNDDLARAEVQRAIQSDDFDKAVETIENLEVRRPLSPHELVLKARFLQLGTGAHGDELQKAEAALRAALAADNEYVPALVELGWFTYAVADDALGSKALFEKAFEISSRDCKEALKGLYKAEEEIESASVARDMLADRVAHVANMSTILSKSRDGQSND